MERVVFFDDTDLVPAPDDCNDYGQFAADWNGNNESDDEGLLRDDD